MGRFDENYPKYSKRNSGNGFFQKGFIQTSKLLSFIWKVTNGIN